MATKEEKAAAAKAKAEAAAAAAADTDTDDDEADDDATATPTPPDANTAPDGQTAAGSGELGTSDDDFENPVTSVDNLGTASDTRVLKDNGDDDSPKTPKLFTSLTKALGLKASQLLGFNERTRVAVYDNGGKYQVSKNNKAVRHLAGPPPPADLKINVVDARSRSPFVGTAAAINASTHDTADTSVLATRRAQLERELAEVNAQIGEG